MTKNLYLWRYEKDPSLERNNDHATTILDEAGRCLQVYAHINEGAYMEGFFQGKKTFVIERTCYIKHVQLLNGHVVGIGLKPEDGKERPLPAEKLKLFEWDFSGNLVDEHSLYSLRESDAVDHWGIESNDQYYVICAESDAHVAAPTKVYVLDLHTKRSATYALGFEQSRFIGSIALDGNYLLIGSSKWIGQEQPFSHTFAEAEITRINLNNGQCVNSIQLHAEGAILQLFGYNERLFYTLDWTWTHYCTLHSYDLTTKESKHICFTFNPHIDEAAISFSRIGDYLNICYLNTDSIDQPFQSMLVWDLKTQSKLNEKTHLYQGIRTFFSAGILSRLELVEGVPKLIADNYN